MLEINTIADFQALPTALQAEIQKALHTKDRLDDFLRSLNDKNDVIEPPHEGRWDRCPRCRNHAGWVWQGPGRDSSDIHPSAINKCAKFSYWACVGEADKLEERIDPRLRMIFDIGHAWHDIIQKYGKMGAWGERKYYHPEVPIDPDAKTVDGVPVLPLAERYWIRGAVDALIDKYVCVNVPGIGDLSIRVIHEYKTINSGGFGKLTRPKPAPKYQANIYAAVFNVPIVVYLYTNKDNCYIADFPVPFDVLIWNEIVQKIDFVQYYVNSEEPMPWEHTSAVKNPAECMECGFRRICAPPMVKLTRKSA